jgi:hypothetical protein
LLLIILIYPAISTGGVSVTVRSTKIERADHIYVTVNGIWAHRRGQANTVGWTLVTNQSQSVDLVALVNSTKSLGAGQLPAASYDAVRLELSNVTWVFNKTTTQLTIVSPRLDARLEFTAMVGRESPITIVLGGQQQTVGSARVFAATLSATMT